MTSPDPFVHHEAADQTVDAVIVGAGFAGLYMLKRLVDQGVHAVVLEAGDDIGGTWFWNRYPGARCDVESVDYSYSFSEDLEQEWDWTERFATQPEILSYVYHVAERFGLRRHIQTSTLVTSAELDESSDTWLVTTGQGTRYRARYCIMATGCLSVPSAPRLPGSDSFDGETFHTGRWPHEQVDFTGKRVGVIGTGSSGTQFIPVVAQEAEHLYVFQRTPNFTVPANNRPLRDGELEAVKASYAERRAVTRTSATGLFQDMNRVSALEVSPEERQAIYEQNWQTAGFGFILSFSDLLLDPVANQTAIDFLHGRAAELIDDPEVARLLTDTNYPFGSKRPCVDTGFYDAFNRDDVTLVDVRSDPIVGITPAGIRTEGREYELDAIAYATGFDAMTGALARIDIRGRSGVQLGELWREGPSSYLGLAMAGFPNLFMITGPGSPSVLSNVMVAIEQHVEWLSDLFEHVRAEQITVVEAEELAEVEWTEHVDDIAYESLYPVGSSWYLGPEREGRRRRFMPYAGGLRAYRRKCDEVAAQGYTGFVLK